MADILEKILQAWQAQSNWEVIAVILGVAYLVLAIRQSNWCWYAAFASTAIFSWLFWDVSLVMESALNLYYLVMAVYGWWAWKHGNADATQDLPIQTWRIKQHGIVIVSVLSLTVLSGWLLTENTGAALPYLDSFTTWGSVITTYMVARKVLENWLYWQVFNSCAIVLYIDRELYLVAALMAVYLVLAVLGWIRWRGDFKRQNSAEAVSAAA